MIKSDAIEFSTFWKMLGFGLEADFSKRTWTLTVGPIKLKELKIPQFRALASDEATIERILSEMFIKRAVMWIDFRRERVSDCIASLSELEQLCGKTAEEFSATGKDADQIISSMCRGWECQCHEAIAILKSGIEEERAPENTGMDISATDYIPDALGDMRKKTYPLIQMLIELLPEESEIRTIAKEKLVYGKDELIRHYGVSSSDIEVATVS
ncbi:hypothetical protein [Nitrospirillum bahiense]|uniref:Uncharacterized protein n=1 Tax=Nitrospirillum amazonense TaxID=28077 RepID=A0A560FHP9_9PROT|nr:hypothetical protein [Nitrospirillum amazonense]TWB21115.1 hypothetical protein FBZ88_11989 [Nitrospirillum amazonense]